MASIAPYINAMGESVIWWVRHLGARDAETEWPAVTWSVGACFDCDCFHPDCFACGGQIKVMVDKVSSLVRDTPQGRLTETKGQMYTAVAVSPRDRVEYSGYMWEVEDAQFKHPHLSLLGYYDCTIVRLE